MYILLLLGELVALYILSRILNQSIFSLSYRLSHSEHISITITTLILFPGTVVHELSHLFIAEIIGVRTGKLTLIPERINAHHIQAGSVQVQRTDPFRRTIIGLAPIFVGIIIITLLSIQLTNMFPTAYLELTTHNIQHTTILFFLLGYLLFAISNNMFSSKEDLEGVPPVLILIGLIIGACYAIGFRVELAANILGFLHTILTYLTKNLGIVLGINLVLLIFLRSILYLFWKRV